MEGKEVYGVKASVKAFTSSSFSLILLSGNYVIEAIDYNLTKWSSIVIFKHDGKAKDI